MASVKGGNPSGPSNVAIDTVAAEDFQRVKLVDGTIGSAAAIGTASAPLRVDPTGSTAQPISGSVTVSGTVTVNGSAATQPVSAAALPLPTGASTEATLAAQSAKLPATLGQKAMAASLAVTLASDQSTIAVSNASLPLPTGAATETTLAANGVLAGAVNETAPATDTASSGLNGRLQRIAQRLTSLIALLPASLGQKNSAGSLAVTIASDQTAVPVSGSVTATVGTVTAVTAITNVVHVDDNAGSLTVDNAGTFVVQAAQSGTWNDVVSGDVASGVADSGNPVKMGGRASSTAPTAVTAGQRANAWLGLNGQQYTALVDGTGQAGTIFPAGFVRTTDEPHQIFYDPFDGALDTTNRWAIPISSGGGVTASTTTGVSTLGSGTTASGYSYLESQTAFRPTIPSWLGASFAISFSDGASFGTNASRFWGIGTSPVTPTAASPIFDGYGFEIDTTGALTAVVFASGVRTVVATLTSPGDTNSHRYIVVYRTDRTYWYIDSLATPVATSNFQTPNIQTLPLKFSAVANTVAPAASRVISCTGVAVWDTGKNNYTLSDGTYGWRTATIKPASTAPVAADTGLVVGMHPSAPLPAGSNLIGAVTTPELVGLLYAMVREQAITNQLLQMGLNVPIELDAMRVDSVVTPLLN